MTSSPIEGCFLLTVECQWHPHFLEGWSISVCFKSYRVAMMESQWKTQGAKGSSNSAEFERQFLLLVASQGTTNCRDAVLTQQCLMCHAYCCIATFYFTFITRAYSSCQSNKSGNVNTVLWRHSGMRMILLLN